MSLWFVTKRTYLVKEPNKPDVLKSVPNEMSLPFKRSWWPCLWHRQVGFSRKNMWTARVDIGGGEWWCMTTILTMQLSALWLPEWGTPFWPTNNLNDNDKAMVAFGNVVVEIVLLRPGALISNMIFLSWTLPIQHKSTCIICHLVLLLEMHY